MQPNGKSFRQCSAQSEQLHWATQLRSSQLRGNVRQSLCLSVKICRYDGPVRVYLLCNSCCFELEQNVASEEETVALYGTVPEVLIALRSIMKGTNLRA